MQWVGKFGELKAIRQCFPTNTFPTLNIFYKHLSLLLQPVLELFIVAFVLVANTIYKQ